MPSKTHKYALNPIRANADLSMKLAHNPKPEIVPIMGPNVFSMYTYAPPEEGMAEASSDFEIAPGRITKPANKYANQIPPKGDSPPPNSIIAREGRDKKAATEHCR